MSTVDEWAKREAEKRWPDAVQGATTFRLDTERQAYMQGLLDLAALLLSDEAVEAAAVDLRVKMTTTTDTFEDCYRAALTAALTKITEDKE